MSELALVYVTNPSREKAEEIAGHLLEKKLIACANIFPVHSMYFWDGKLEKGDESVMIAKTTEDKYKEVEEEIKKVHPYSVPCIIKIPATSNKEYYDYVAGIVKKKPR